jgi:hypothetical protein
MTTWTKATLLSGQPIYLDLDKMTAIKRVRGQGKDFTAVYCGPNAQPFEVTETPEDFGIALKSESDAGASS